MMFEREKRWAGVVLSSFAGSDAGFTAAEDVDYVAGATLYLSRASEKARLGLRFAFVLAYTAPLWMFVRFSTLGGLEREERARVMAVMGRHRVFAIRELCLLLKLVACFAIFRSPASRARSGYDRESDDRPKKPALSVLGGEAA